MPLHELADPGRVMTTPARRPWLTIGHHYGHHSVHSGYDRLGAYLDADYLDLTPVTVGRTYWGRPLGRFARPVAGAVARMAARRRSLLHVFYPENLFGPPFSKRHSKLVATLHHPFDFYFGDLWRNRASASIMRMIRYGLREVDGVILLTPTEVSRFAGALPRARVCVIPHGVDDFSQRSTVGQRQRSSRFSICSVGHNYRDIDLLRNLVMQATAAGRPWDFHFVGMQHVGQELARISPCVTAHQWLDEDAYLGLLAMCDAHVLPLTHATANNALLEAHSVGTPSFVTDLPDVDLYCLEDTVRFRGVDDLMRNLSSVADNPDQLARLRKRTLAGAKAFHWGPIARRVSDFYREVESAHA